MKNSLSIRELLTEAVRQLQDMPTPKLDAEILLSHTLEKPRAYLHTWPNKILTTKQIQTFNQLCKKRQQGVPVAYLVGHKEFWSMKFRVTPDVLIPRPETELLVETALDLIPKSSAQNILDLGTGCGAIALALSKERQNCSVLAVDQSDKAIETAKHNAEKFKLTNVQFKKSDWFDELSDQKFDIIVSNPPYVPEGDPHFAGEIRFEPKEALASGADGLNDIRIIAKQALKHLNANGYLILEHGYDQAESVRKILSGSGYQNIKTKKDIGGHERITIGVLDKTA